MAEVPPAPATDSWVNNTNVGNFNPGKKKGRKFSKIIQKISRRRTASQQQIKMLKPFLFYLKIKLWKQEK